MGYILDFVNRNKKKPFIKNLKKYSKLDSIRKKVVVSSFLTHLLIDSETYNNIDYIRDVISILNNFIFFEDDKFLEWFEDLVSKER